MIGIPERNRLVPARMNLRKGERQFHGGGTPWYEEDLRIAERVAPEQLLCEQDGRLCRQAAGNETDALQLLDDRIDDAWMLMPYVVAIVAVEVHVLGVRRVPHPDSAGSADAHKGGRRVGLGERNPLVSRDQIGFQRTR